MKFKRALALPLAALFVLPALLLGGGMAAQADPPIPCTGDICPIQLSPTIASSSTLPSGRAGLRYQYDLHATGLPAPQCAVVSGTLPPGLALNRTSCVISGTPTAASSSYIGVTASNVVGTVTAHYQLTIVPAGFPPCLRPVTDRPKCAI